MNRNARNMMNRRIGRDYGMKMDRRPDGRYDGRMGRMDGRGRDYRMDSNDYRGGDYRGSMEFSGDYRRGSDYGRDYGNDYGHDYGHDYGESEYDRDYGNDYGENDKLKPEELERWKHDLKNEDGTTGPHFTPAQISRSANQLGIPFNRYTEEELCMAANMLYSDYGNVLRSCISKEKEPMIYAALAKAFLEDKDGMQGSEKLSVYYHCIAEE